MPQSSPKSRLPVSTALVRVAFALTALLTATGLVSLPASATAAGDDYPRLDAFRPLVSEELHRQTLETLQRREPVTLRFRYRDLCGSAKGTFAWSLSAIASSVYERANTFAGKVQNCPEACAPTVNKAEFCGYVANRQREIQALKAWDKGFFEAYSLLSEAGRTARLPEEQLETGFYLIATPALEWLAKAMRDGEAARDSRHALAISDLRDFRMMLQTLSGEGILQGQSAPLLEALDTALSGLTGPSDQTGKPDMLRSAAELAWVERILEHSAREAGARREAHPNTTAAAPAATLPGQSDWREAAACFQRLSLDASTAADGIWMELDLIGNCRDTSACSGATRASQPDIETVLDVVERSFKAQYALTGSMCREKGKKK